MRQFRLRSRLILLCLFFTSSAGAYAQKGFRVVPLGVKGGVDDGNLSAYMVAPARSSEYICLDAGTVSGGIQKAVQQGVFKIPAQAVLKQYLKAYFISHPHLDHVSGMIVTSVEDTAKSVYGFPACINTLRDHYFNWQSWPNLTSAGALPALNKFRYETLTEAQEIAVPGTGMQVTPFRLSHTEPYESAAFLVRHQDEYLLYFGDTGPDVIEGKGRMKKVWDAAAPLLKAGRLKGVFLEVSYPNAQPDSKLYGHLTPRWFMQELQVLADLAGQELLKGLPVIVTHIKPAGKNEGIIRQELAADNHLKVKLIFPRQGEAVLLR
ncbi:MBL fold metallo-hydrolase [Dyadobacter sandarakinus]|uniref:3',5'-cyclic-nucleotide phosphodiesterase n=1 Tax=Dyadobacter sandarakinus TaxID=2747268 RepID=A0ABX7IBE9_9BACT|nr:3',5'-cyclic-nucleotide phosphodiesterase [Dyadobacter sandarakinus]QRR03305.1 3',5'-cyclic-nucleotide phosphodiesterase [Dyadobacter sandarakinus]